MFNWLRSSRSSLKINKDDQRSSVRVPLNRKRAARLMARVGSSAWPAAVQDLTAEGVGLVLGLRHEPGTSLPIDLVNTHRDYSCPRRVRVVHVSPRGDGYWAIGCAFVNKLGDAELEALL